MPDINLKPLEGMGKYATVAIDPPWDIPFGPILPKGGQWSKETMLPELPYPAMSLSTLKALPVCHTLADDALLFCWTVNKMLPHTFALVESWGTSYWFTMTWHKTNGMQMPNSPKYNGEWVIVGRKGKPEFTDIKALWTVNHWPSGGHSEKPEGFYDLLRRVTPGPRLDVFGRRRIAGFESWGNEAPDGPALPDHYQTVFA